MHVTLITEVSRDKSEMTWKLLLTDSEMNTLERYLKGSMAWDLKSQRTNLTDD